MAKWYQRRVPDKFYKPFRKVMRQAYGAVIPKYGGAVFDAAEYYGRRAFPVAVPSPSGFKTPSKRPSKITYPSSGTRFINKDRLIVKRPRPAVQRRRLQGMKMRGTPFGKMFRGKRIKRAPPMLLRGVGCEFDAHEVMTAPRTIYVGHYTHPSKTTIGVLAQALAKYIGRVACKDNPTSMDQIIGQAGGTHVLRGFHVMIYYQQEKEDTTSLEEKIAVGGGVTYLAFGNLIETALYNIVGGTSTDNKPLLKHLIVRGYDSGVDGAYEVASPITIPFSELSVSIRGISELKLQNTTLADTLGSSDIHNIDANPIEGRCYYGKGSQFRVRDTDLVAGASDAQLQVSSTSGVGSLDPATLANARQQRLLEHAGNHKKFYGFSSSQYVRLQPGRMVKSLISKTHTLKFNQWLAVLYRGMFSTEAAHGTLSYPTSIGVSKWYGLDKMIHDSGDGNTLVNTEYHIKMMGVVSRQKKSHITNMYPVLF